MSSPPRPARALPALFHPPPGRRGGRAWPRCGGWGARAPGAPPGSGVRAPSPRGVGALDPQGWGEAGGCWTWRGVVGRRAVAIPAFVWPYSLAILAEMDGILRALCCLLVSRFSCCVEFLGLAGWAYHVTRTVAAFSRFLGFAALRGQAKHCTTVGRGCGIPSR
ncbi:unnamed protein product [Prorocentrum cordatum]|uniref:Uncharacterized protein n=1 Tax=Prorocentrum cordatum TaxID=2364126 RepID=A0ABN9QLU4_9DINO|nr:unnamed protein product [Polarella glacialis]